MAQDKDKRWYDKPLIPTAIGVVVWAISYIAPRGPGDPLKHVYFSCPHSEEYTPSAVEGAGGFEMGGVRSPTIVFNKIKLYSGEPTGVPVKLAFRFETDKQGFRILGVGHAVSPGMNLRRIKEKYGANSGELEYEYLNSGDQDIIMVLTNAPARLYVEGGGKGVALVPESIRLWSALRLVGTLVGIAAIIGGIAWGVIRFRNWKGRIQQEGGEKTS